MAHVTNAALRGAKWWHKGYAGLGNVEHLLDSCLGRPAIVAGSGRGVFEEVIQVTTQNALVFAANDVGMYLPRVDHWVSLHGPRLELWAAIRRDPTGKPMGNLDFQLHDAGLHGPRDYHQWTGLTPIMALSGMFAAQIAYLMGCAPIILCGCPNDSTPRFFETECKNHDYTTTQRSITEEMGFKPEFKAVVRSMSGWTREFFGTP